MKKLALAAVAAVVFAATPAFAEDVGALCKGIVEKEGVAADSKLTKEQTMKACECLGGKAAGNAAMTENLTKVAALPAAERVPAMTPDSKAAYDACFVAQ